MSNGCLFLLKVVASNGDLLLEGAVSNRDFFLAEGRSEQW